MKNCLFSLLAALALMSPAIGAAQTPPHKTRVLIVGGDWKSQLPNYQGKTPLRGFFIKQEVEKVAPGKFEFTLWTSYEFLQYGDAESLGRFDVIMAGDFMGESVLPRLVSGVEQFVRNGGGFWYCDNHKAFSFITKECSFDAVLPIEVVSYRAYEDPPNDRQPTCTEKPLLVHAAVPHPILAGLDLTTAPPLLTAKYGKLKAGATVIATSPAGVPVWVAGEHGDGRVFWTGGVFANDELSRDFANWPQIGQFYAQALAWLAEKSKAPVATLTPGTADGTLMVDFSKPGPELTGKHFGVHGQESEAGFQSRSDADLALYQALNLDGAFARTSAFEGIKAQPGGARFELMDDGTGLSQFDPGKYDFKAADLTLADIDSLHATPLFLYWVPWGRTAQLPDKERFTKYFAASIEHLNGHPGPDYKPRLSYFEIMNEPALGPMKVPPLTHEQVMSAYADFVNYAATTLGARYPGLKFGVGGFHEWPYIQETLDRCGKNLAWISRHPYGQTGEAIFALQDAYAQHARELGLNDMKFIITEWDFWIYGEPAFDYIMQRWKPVADHADTCLGTLHYRWREYQEGGYVFGVKGEFDHAYGELPPEWPNPGKDKPITYRYDAFWLMRHARGPQFAANLDIPALRTSQSPRAYAIATTTGQQLNVVLYYGYPYPDTKTGKLEEKLHVRVDVPLPPQVKGRTLVIERADSRRIETEPAQPIKGDRLQLDLEIPSLSGVSLTVE